MKETRLHKKVYLIRETTDELSEVVGLIRDKGFQLIEDTNLKDMDLVNRICSVHPDLIIWDVQKLDGETLSQLVELENHMETAFTPIYLWNATNGVTDQYGDQLEAMDQVHRLAEDFSSDDWDALLSNRLKPTVGIKFWGVRGSTPCANKENIRFGGNTTCVQIELPFSDELLILDSGTGIRNLGNYLNEFRENVEGNIFITHPHWDHIQGFPFFKPIYNPNNSFKVHMPPQATGGCREILSGHLTKTFFPVTLDMFDANLEYVTLTPEQKQFNGYSIEYQFANHPINTAIYKLRIAGKSIVFCPDNELTPIEHKTNAYFYKKLKEFFKDVDVLIHDSQYSLGTYKDKVRWGHSAWETAVDFARRSSVKNLFLTHHDPDSSDTYLRDLDEQIRSTYETQFDSIQLAREGAKIELEVAEPVSG